LVSGTKIIAGRYVTIRAQTSNLPFLLLFFLPVTGNQEPGTSEEILEFTKKKGATFSILNKIHVNGPKADPLFVYLKSKLKGSFGSFIKWNFTKFICNKNGIPIKRFGPTTPPSAMEDMIGGLLNEELTTVRMERSMSGTTSMATTRLLNEQHQ
tara:strand:- start:366 stop:827 length:462 start_codon:yes stop_codon:yes gene_type:complete